MILDEQYARTEMPGLYKATDGGMYLLDDFGYLRRLNPMVANLLCQRYINAMAALAGRVY